MNNQQVQNWNMPVMQGLASSNPQIPLWMQQQQNQMNQAGFQLPTSASQQQNRQVINLPCRVVQSMNDILPGEVPMDGTVALFVQADGQKIYAKQWNQKGNIDTVEYELNRPEEIVVSENASNDAIRQLENKVDQIIGILNDCFSAPPTTVTKRGGKKTTKEEVENAE